MMKRKSEEEADVGAGVEDADGLGAFFGGEPFGDGCDGGGDVAALAEA